MSAGAVVPARVSMARSSISAGQTSSGMPALSSTARRTALFDASTSGRSGSQSATSRGRQAAAFGQKLEHRRRGFLDRASGYVDRWPVVLGAKFTRERHFLGHRRTIDILVISLMGLQAQEPILPDLHDALGTGIEPDHQRAPQLFDARGSRNAGHQRNVAGLNPAVG